MKRKAFFVFTVTLSALAAGVLWLRPQLPSPVAGALARDVEIAPWGFDLKGMHPDVKPGDDFVAFANGQYLHDLVIPKDLSRYGTFDKLREDNEARLQSLINAVVAEDSEPGSEKQKIADYFNSFMDIKTIESKGIGPFMADVRPFLDAHDKKTFARAMGASLGGVGPALFPFFVDQDSKEPDRYTVYFGQAGLGLPDRDFYLEVNPDFLRNRDEYKTHAALLLRMMGMARSDARNRAHAVLSFETKLAKGHWNRVDSRDSDKTYNRMSPDELIKMAPGFPWKDYLSAAGLGKETHFIVRQPTAFAALAQAFAQTPLQVLQDWAVIHMAHDAAPFLPESFVKMDFDFYKNQLSGVPEQRPRWKRAIRHVSDAMGEAIGKIYVANYFPPDSKAQADSMVKNIIAVMDDRLSRLDWMSPETRVKARAKLAHFRPKIGYPDKWRDYSKLKIVSGDAYGNAVRARRFDYERNLAKLGRPVDRDEWFMYPMTVNAYANPTMNEIVFPAAILQPPFFDPQADPAVNYGAIGAVIGHEITHHFDDQGRKYDPDGRLNPWWTKEDVARFTARAAKLVKQYDAYAPLPAPAPHVNGALTLGENIADLAGLVIAYDAYLRSVPEQDIALVRDAYNGKQRFFLGYAQVWRQKYRPAELLQRLKTGPHTPGMLRPYAVRNMDAWYDVWNVGPEDKLYLKKAERVSLW